MGLHSYPPPLLKDSARTGADVPNADVSNKVPFTRAVLVGREREYVAAALDGPGFTGGGGTFYQRCQEWFGRAYPGMRSFLTPSCTHALEAAAMACGLGPGDEVILPSFTFASTANAMARTGATLVFVDVDPGTMNIDPACVAAALTDRTRAVVAVHYAGVACDMERLGALAEAHRLWLIEDAAQAMMCFWRGRPLGTLGHFAAFSFHETKTIQCGEGGALLTNEARFGRCETVIQKGTNRSRFLRGEVDRYTWESIGSSCVMPEVSAAILLAQLEAAAAVVARRRRLWDVYAQSLAPLAQAGHIDLVRIPANCTHAGHIFYFKAADLAERSALIDHLRAAGVQATFHYVPLHSSPAGRRLGRFAGEDRHTTRDSERLVRLPLYHGLREDQVLRVAALVQQFYGER